MKPVFGIHIGNTNVTLAICKDNDHPEIVANDAGDRITPAMVTVTDSEIIVGAAAKSATMSQLQTTISSNKTMMEMKVKLCEKFQDQMVLRNNEVYYSLTLGEKIKYVSPQQIATYILKKLYETAKNTINSKEEQVSCVLLASVHSSDEFCEKYRTAAEDAGWTVLQIINEPAAAVLAYSLLDTVTPPQTLLVYRLGDTTCEVTAYNLTDGMLFVLGSEHSEELGGCHFTKTLLEYFTAEFFRKYKLDIRENRRSLAKLKLASENCVHILSKMQAANCYIESLHEGVDFNTTISRPQFELLTQPILAKLTVPMKQLLDRLQLRKPVDTIVLCGGATNVPKLQSHITGLFNPDVTQVLTCPNADELLALGAAKQAYNLVKHRVTEFLPRSQKIHFEVSALSDSTSSESFTSDEENL
uniref:Heat shock 70 kDa protein 14 n=1 Tax=Graphocephala atropunctata TaxID=36148 RepID=A0A1B6LMX9_9HEMI